MEDYFNKESITCSPKGNLMATYTTQHWTLKVIDTNLLQLKLEIDMNDFDIPQVMCFSSCEDVIYISINEKMYFWSLETGALIRTIDSVDDAYSIRSMVCYQKYLVTGSNACCVKVWNRFTGELIHFFTDHENVINKVLMTKDEQLVYSGSSDLTIRVWNLESGLLEKTYQGSKGISAMALSEDESLLIAGYFDGTCSVWNTHTDQLTFSFRHVGSKRPLWSWSSSINALFCEEGSLVTSSLDGTINFWSSMTQENLKGGKCLTHQVSTAEVPFLYICTRFILSSSLDNTIKLWERKDPIGKNYLNKCYNRQFVDAFIVCVY
jgi:WD40 repeat protein